MDRSWLLKSLYFPSHILSVHKLQLTVLWLYPESREVCVKVNSSISWPSSRVREVIIKQKYCSPTELKILSFHKCCWDRCLLKASFLLLFFSHFIHLLIPHLRKLAKRLVSTVHISLKSMLMFAKHMGRNWYTQKFCKKGCILQEDMLCSGHFLF